MSKHHTRLLAACLASPWVWGCSCDGDGPGIADSGPDARAADAQVRTDADARADVGVVDAGASDAGASDAGPITCPPAIGPGTDHEMDIAADETWAAADGPHRVNNGLTVTATLTIEPCTQVLLAGAIVVSGTLIAEGTATAPISFDRLAVDTPWAGLSVPPRSGGQVRLAHATLRDGGDPIDANIRGVLDMRADVGGALAPTLKVVDVRIESPRTYGVVMRDRAAFTADSRGLTITGGAASPMAIETVLAGSIPTGSYTGNAVDELVLTTDESVDLDTTLRARGVPYRLGAEAGSGQLYVGVSGPVPMIATLTVEAGVIVRVIRGGAVFLTKNAGNETATGRLVVAGTAAAPVVFTSTQAAPRAGHWRGLVFQAPDPLNTIDYAEVAYAGGPSGANSFHCEPDGSFSNDEDAAIGLFGEPDSVFVRNTTIRASAGDGIGRSWSGSALDFSPTNTFIDVAECAQSWPRDTNGSCAGPARCP